MFRRNSSRNPNRRPLSRSKSTNSLPTRNSINSLQTIDPAAAQRDAYIAATLSYYRAHGRYPETMMPAQPSVRGLARSDSCMSRSVLTRPDSVVDSDAHAGSSGLKRQQSVRFTGPNARPRRPLATRATDSTYNHRTEQTSSRASTRYDIRSGSSCADTTLQPMDDHYTPEDDIASMPSSYRRLRKSRSMFTSSLSHGSYSFANDTWAKSKGRPGTPRYGSLNKENEPAMISATPGLRAPKSTSFLRNHSNREASRTSSRAENDLALHLARDKFREQVKQQTKLKSYPSIFFRSKNKRSDSAMGFRKSMRNSSNTSAPVSSVFSGDTILVSKHTSLRGTARKVSKSLKNKLKGLFARSSTDADEENHDGIAAVDLEDDSHLCDELPPPEEASMSQGPSRMPSLHAVPTSQQMRSHQGSVESVDIEETPVQDDRSRVTSWANSTTNTAPSILYSGDWERQRLSVIKENGAHVSSASLSRPMTGHESIAPAQLPAGASIDSQRVYSALMKRLEDLRQGQERLRKKSMEDIRAYGIGPPRTSSMDHSESRGWSPATIRCVPNDDDVFQDRSNSATLKDQSTQDLGENQHISEVNEIASTCEPTNSEAGPKKDLSHVTSAKVNKEPSQTLSSRSSAFFASPTCHLFRTASPYRRALRESMKTEVSAQALPPETTYLKSLSELSLPARQPSFVGSERDTQTADAKSVYSTNDNNTELYPFKSPWSMKHSPQSSTSHGHGDATIFVDNAKHKYERSHTRELSTASSVEWKTWLSANVSKLEATGVELHHGPSTPYTLPTLGHVREHAEIESPLDAKSQVSEAGPNPGERVLKARDLSLSTPPANLTLSRFSRPSHQGDENSLPTGDNSMDSHGLTLSAPCGTKLRSAASLPCVKVDGPGSGPGPESVLPRMRSFNTMTRPSPLSREELARRRRGRVGLGKDTPSPGLTVAVERQFGKTMWESPARSLGWMGPKSTTSLRSETNASEDSCSYKGAGMVDSEMQAQAMGSRRMVDLFLSSRRRMVHGSKSGTKSESSPSVFI